MRRPSDNNMTERGQITLSSPEQQRTGPSNSAQSRSGKARANRRNSLKTEACEDHVNPALASDCHTGTDHPNSQPLRPTSTDLPSQQDIEIAIRNILIDHGGGMAIFTAFETASPEPPITPESLTELDVQRIINNPKLRHDVNFDRELHFRPNLDGARGKQKMKCADNYWKALEGELYMLNAAQRAWLEPASEAHPGYWQALLKASRKRLPRIFEVVRDILKTLVPDVDQPKILERLDVDLLIQQIDNGMCDLVDLANWLAKVLKNHCAPMRDTMVDKMQHSITKGAKDANQALMVDGLRQLLTILEAMKLDVANHQIRHMRPLLIADTVNFQQRYNNHRIGLGKLDAEESRMWLHRAHEDLCETEDMASTYLESLTTALLSELIFASHKTCLTATFYLDIDRLRAIRVDMHNAIYHRICGDIMIRMIASEANKYELPKALSALQASLTAIVGSQSRWTENLDNIAAEIMRIVLMLEGRNTPYDADLASLAELKLSTDLAPESTAFANHARDLADRLLPKMKENINSHRRLPAIDLQEALVAPLQSAPSAPIGYGAVCEPVGPTRSTDPEPDLVRRFTHVVVLHWQVWADLVYLAPPDSDSEHETVVPRSPSPSVSPEPVARAVFSEGHKFLADEVVTVTVLPHALPPPPQYSGPGLIDHATHNQHHQLSTHAVVTRPERKMPTATTDSESEPKDSEQQDSTEGTAPFLPSDRGN